MPNKQKAQLNCGDETQFNEGGEKSPHDVIPVVFGGIVHLDTELDLLQILPTELIERGEETK